MVISFTGAQFPQDVILPAAFFCLRDAVSYRDLEEIMAERAARADHDPRFMLSKRHPFPQPLTLAPSPDRRPWNCFWNAARICATPAVVMPPSAVTSLPVI